MTERPRALLAAAAVVVVTLAVYWRALGAGFEADDFMILHRLRALAAPGDVLRFFRGEFFEYYRPLPFVLHAIDWRIAGADPRQFHLTNLLLHAANAVLVLLIARRLSPAPAAGLAAALLFALHPSNHEAVVWVSARFDLLATLFSLAAVLCLVDATRAASAAGAAAFIGAVLSKESAVALPIAAAASAVFLARASRRETAVRLVPWLVALGLYAAARHLAGGVSSFGGSSRLPKVTALVVLLAVLWLGAGQRWTRLAHAVRDRSRALTVAALAAIAALAAAAASGGRVGSMAAEKLAVAGFAIVNLASPFLDLFDRPFYLYPDTVAYWAGGVAAAAAAVLLLGPLVRRIVSDDRLGFLVALLVAAVLPISALTEGTRYLYLPSAVVSLAAGILVAEQRGRAGTIVRAITALVIAISAWQIVAKLADWQWAGRMTVQAMHLVDEVDPSTPCANERIVLLTQPVALRGVYTHINEETFEVLRAKGCIPDSFRTVLRLMRIDQAVEIAWDGPSRIAITVPGYRDTLVAAADLRTFDLPLTGAARNTSIDTPLGVLDARDAGGTERVTLTLARGLDPRTTRFFYYSGGAVHYLPPPAR